MAVIPALAVPDSNKYGEKLQTALFRHENNKPREGRYMQLYFRKSSSRLKDYYALSAYIISKLPSKLTPSP